MTSIFPYLLEASLILLLLYAFYFLVLRQKATPLLNRCYLLISLVFALTVPVLSIPLSLGGVGESSSIFQPASKAWNLLPELVISGANGQETAVAGTSEISWLQYAWYLYLAGLTISFLFTVGRLWKLSRLIRQYPFHHTITREYKIAPTNGKLPTFSFFHYIFWDDTAPLSKEEAKLVLRHEEAHVQQHHSIDNIVLELLGALLWFNPVIYAYRHSLRQVHEHLADRYALGEAPPESYFSLLVKQTLRQANLPLASQFFQHNTLNRIKMLKTKSNRTILRSIIGASIFGIIFFVAACEDEKMLESDNQIGVTKSKKDAVLQSHQLILDIEYLNDEEEINNNNFVVIHEENLLIYIIGNAKYSISDYKNEEVKNKVENALINIPREKLGKKGEKIPHILVEAVGNSIKPGPNFEKMNIISTANNEPPPPPSIVFEVVEESPTPVGGMEAYYTYLKNNLKFPEEAKAKGVEGRVFVQFVVMPDGSVTEVKVVKGIGAGCDEAALEAVKKTQWIPGKQRGQEVAVRMVLPVMFKL